MAGRRARRDKPGFRHETSGPDLATHNWWERDLLIAAHIRRGIEERGLALLTVDGSRPLDEMASLVERHFGPLPPGARSGIPAGNTWRGVMCGRPR